MLSSLKFVKGAVSRKDFIPALTHFRIRDSRITGYNGKLSLSAPIALDVDCCPKADKFVKAIDACEGTAAMNLTPTGKLSIRSGKFRGMVDTLEVDVYPEVEPEGVPVEITGALLPALSTMYGFTGEDASRPWAAGILFNGDSIFATNNTIVAEYWLGYHFPFRVCVPRYAVKEMIRIGEEPIGLRMSAKSMTVYYSGDRWLRTQLNSTEWPNAAEMLETRGAGGSGDPVPEGFFEALETLEPFVDEQKRVYFQDGRIATATEEGTTVDVPGVHGEGKYNVSTLLLLQDVATHIDFAAYPAPCGWRGKMVRGLIVGMRS